jgi:hypothetical protein
MEQEQAYYIRIETRSDYLNLLFYPEKHSTAPTIQAALFQVMQDYADPTGVLVYFDNAEHCFIGIRSKDVHSLRIYMHDDEAPYEGFLVDRRLDMDNLV